MCNTDVVFSHAYTSTYICWIHTDAIIIQTSENFFKKYISHFIVRFACERELETDQRLQHIDLTSPSGHSRVSFSFSWCSTGVQGAQISAECWLFLPHLVTNGSPKLLGAPRAPSTVCGFPYPISSLTRLISNSSDHQLTDFLSLPSYLIVQSPTQSPTQYLEWHVWLSSSGNNYHAVQRSLSSGASVYECIMGFYLVPFRQPNPHARFLSITGHWNVPPPSGASLWNGMFGWVESQYTKLIVRKKYVNRNRMR